METIKESLKETTANVNKLIQVEAIFQATLDEALRKGFHGLAAIELMIHDGTIHRISRKVEQVDK